MLRRAFLIALSGCLTLLSCMKHRNVNGGEDVQILKNFSLFDGSGRDVLPAAALVIRHGRIAWVGKASDLKDTGHARVIDLTGKFVTPGLIDLHVHLGLADGLDLNPAKYYDADHLAAQLTTYARYGFTSVLTLGTDLPPVYDYLAAQQRQQMPRARLYSGGRGFAYKGGFPTEIRNLENLPFIVSSAEDIRADMDELAKHRPVLTKLWVDDDLGTLNEMPLQLSRGIIDEARKHNLRSVAHIYRLRDAQQLIDAGLNAIVHSVRDARVDQALIRSMKERGAWLLSPTLSREYSTFIFADNPPFLNDPFFMRCLTSDVVVILRSQAFQNKLKADPNLPVYRKFFQTAIMNFRSLSRAGVRYGFGTDTGLPMRFAGYFDHLELQFMNEAGLSPKEVLMAATKSGSEYLGASDIGTLEPGKWADLVVFGKNPLDAIQNSRTIERVAVAGKWVSGIPGSNE